jgi:hypothetical protein
LLDLATAWEAGALETGSGTAGAAGTIAGFALWVVEGAGVGVGSLDFSSAAKAPKEKMPQSRHSEIRTPRCTRVCMVRQGLEIIFMIVLTAFSRKS